jgi:osmotically-inducible protein OsmY
MRSARRVLPRALLPILVMMVILMADCMFLTGKTLRENFDDGSVTTSGKAKLAADEATSLTRIGVQTVQGVVHLTGIVETEAMKEHAAEIARQVRGVRSVVNNLVAQNG